MLVGELDTKLITEKENEEPGDSPGHFSPNTLQGKWNQVQGLSDIAAPLNTAGRVQEARGLPPLPAPLQDPHQEAGWLLSLSHLRPVPFLFSGLFAPSLFTL